MNNLILTTISKNDLETLIIDCVNACLKQHQPEETTQPEPQLEYITKKEAAELLKCSIATIDNYRRSGKLKRYNHLGHIVRFKRSEVLAAIEGKSINKKRGLEQSSKN